MVCQAESEFLCDSQWVPMLPGNPLCGLLVDLFTLGERARGSHKMNIIWSPQSP